MFNAGSIATHASRLLHGCGLPAAARPAKGAADARGHRRALECKPRCSPYHFLTGPLLGSTTGRSRRFFQGLSAVAPARAGAQRLIPLPFHSDNEGTSFPRKRHPASFTNDARFPLSQERQSYLEGLEMELPAAKNTTRIGRICPQAQHRRVAQDHAMRAPGGPPVSADRSVPVANNGCNAVGPRVQGQALTKMQVVRPRLAGSAFQFGDHIRGKVPLRGALRNSIVRV
jgi:hypothetical protein